MFLYICVCLGGGLWPGDRPELRAGRPGGGGEQQLRQHLETVKHLISHLTLGRYAPDMYTFIYICTFQL